MKTNYHHTEIRYSSANGPVWLYRGSSKRGARQSYYRTLAIERQRQRRYCHLLRRRQANIYRLLQACLSVVVDAMTHVQHEAANYLQNLAEAAPPFRSPILDYNRKRRHQLQLAKRRQRYWSDAEFRQHERARRRR